MVGLTREQPSSRSSFARHSLRISFATAALLALAACGGGGGGGGDPAPANPSPPPPPPPPTNEAPMVSAGEDQSIELPANSAALAGSAEDADTALTYSWTSEPSDGVAFEDASAASTTVTFTDAGAYTLTLTVSDGEASGSDTLVITVAAPAAEAPVVNAGEDQSLELPNATATLAGSATSDSSTLTYSWTSEPATGVAFASAEAASTTASFDQAGTYVLTLAVSDGSLTGSDSLQIVVGSPVYPGADPDDGTYGWTSATPEDLGMDAVRLGEARDYALTGGGSGLIVRHGRLVFSWGDIGARYDLKSTTKSIGGIALGLAMDDGLLTLSDPAQTHLPSIGNSPHSADDDANDATGWLDDITVLQLATHTAGFPKGGGYELLVAEPGTTWLYSDGGLNWLADLLTEVYLQDLEEVLTSRVWSVLGLDGNDLRWRDNAFRPEPHPAGIARRELASGIQANANAMARVGLLFLRNGVWSNDQRIFSEEFANVVRTPPPEIALLENAEPTDFPAATENYGVLWWTNTTGLLPDVPTDAYWAWGLGDSLIVVIPSLDLVIARTGDNPDAPETPKWRPSWNGDYTVLAPFLTPIVQSIEE